MVRAEVDIEPRRAIGAARVDRALPAQSGAAPTPTELADLVRSFDQAARALQETHEQLRTEVARLEGELGETRAQLHRARELAALGEMAAGIAHEVRNPLGSIRLHAEVLVADLADMPAQRDIARKVARAVDGLNAVVTDVLVFARDMRVRTDAVDARDLFERAVEACTDVASQSNVRIVFDASVSCQEIVCDAAIIHQALVNVIRNACEAVGGVGGGGEPGRHAARPAIRLSVESRSPLESDGTRTDMLALVVADNGPGIPADVIGRIFNPFFTTRSAGTGLGLPIAHRIVDAHGGRVGVRSVDHDPVDGGRGSGTVVELMLPQPAGEEAVLHGQGSLGDAA